MKLKITKKFEKKAIFNNSEQVKYRKMFIYITIVSNGYTEHMMRVFQENGSIVQFACFGRGTAKKEALHMLGLESSNKDIIMAFVDETNVNTVKTALAKTFDENKRLMGIGFTIPLTSIVGEKIYRFLTNTL